MTKNSIHPETTIGAVKLTVSDLERSVTFYRNSLGLSVHRQSNNEAFLGAGNRDLLVLEEILGARPMLNSTGLYHFAILLPTRLHLAQALVNLNHSATQLQGFADHLVSEAIYLADPDGNGIEIYRDRPRNQWSYKNGELQMATLPLDLEGILNELTNRQETWLRLPPSTRIGHIHLKVSSIPKTDAFYTEIFGFDLITRFGSSAGFVSAGGYHHHIAYNTWHSNGAPPPPANAVGLQWFAVELPDLDSYEATLARLRHAEIDMEERTDGILAHDPSLNGILIRRPD